MALPAYRLCARTLSWRRVGAVAAGVVAVSLAAGCGGGAASPASPARAASATAGTSHSAVAAKPASAAPAPSPSASCPASVLASMTEAQRVGQLFLVGLPDNEVAGTVASTITAHHFGSVIFGADSKGGISGARQVAGAVQALTSKPATAGVRFFVAANQEGGQVQALTGPGISAIPSALDQGALRPSALTSMAAAWGRQLRAAGVNLNLAPVMDVVPAGTERGNAPIGALDREYGHDASTVTAHGVAFLRGMAGARVATSAKHFPGLGRVAGNTDFTSSVVDTVTTASGADLQTYQAAIDAGAPMVMVALATYTRIDPKELAVFSPTIIEGLLRKKMGFRGTILSDDMGVAAAVEKVAPGTRAVDFVAAGGDLITTESLPVADAMDSALLSRAGSDASFRSAVDAAALQVLTTKDAYGLLPCSG
jgi:beta-N-acetylhexosaminidase